MVLARFRKPRTERKPSEADADRGTPAPAPPERSGPKDGDDAKPRSLWSRLSGSLARTRRQLGDGIGNLILGARAIDEEVLEELETSLLVADVGVEATTRILGNLRRRVSRRELADTRALHGALRAELLDILLPVAAPLDIGADRPHVVLVVGVNGAGKTTSIGKLAKRLKGDGHSVLLAAGDTFRAAAVEQLGAWGEREDIPVIAQGQGADAASVIFDAVTAAKARGIDVVLADTAGRLQAKAALMEELAKIKRVTARLGDGAPHEVLLVLDAGVGQNALSQVAEFDRAVGLTGLAVTKLDGTAKAGVLFAVAAKHALPVKFIGIGEGIDDLQPFEPEPFVDALLAAEGTADASGGHKEKTQGRR